MRTPLNPACMQRFVANDPRMVTRAPSRPADASHEEESGQAEPSSRNGRQRAKSAATHDRPAVIVRLFDADRTDATLELEEALHRRLSKRQLLWIDLQGDASEEAVAAIAERLELKPSTRRILERHESGAHVALHGTYVHLRVATEADHDPSESPHWLDLLAAGNVVVSSHAEPVGLLGHLDERIETDTTIGIIDAAAFVATAVDAAVTSYFKAVDGIEEAVDRLDGEGAQPRRPRGRPRRARASSPADCASPPRPTSQREVFAAFATPDFGVVAPGEDAEAFQAVARRFEDALQNVEDSRDLLLGSFDVFMTRTAQRTNETMKVLALATVLLLPGSLIAGLLGMNVVVPLPKDDPLGFWIVVLAIGLLAAGVLLFARLRRWI